MKNIEMTAEEFFNQPMDYFIELWNEALEKSDLTIKEKEQCLE